MHLTPGTAATRHAAPTANMYLWPNSHDGDERGMLIYGYKFRSTAGLQDDFWKL